ncbi:MAG: hypothetical protein WBF73_07205 [Bradyrhizobium sp.]
MAHKRILGGHPFSQAKCETTLHMGCTWNATAMLNNLIPNLLVAWKQPRWRWALLTAVLSDALGFGVVLFPPVQWLLDAVTAVVLFAVLGFRWPLLLTVAFEAVPGLEVFPAWTLAVLAMAATETKKLTHST